MEFKDQIMLYCFREVKCQKEFTTYIAYILFRLIAWNVYQWPIVVSKSKFKSRGSRSFPGKREFEFIYQFKYCEPNKA